MNKEQIDSINQYGDSKSFSRPPKMPSYPYLRLDGNMGVFTLTTRNGDKSEKVEVGKQVDIIMLRVRRRLSDFNSGESTTEHNHKGDNVVLFQTDSESGVTRKLDTGRAEEIRERHPELSTEQVIYGLYNSDLVRLIIKGGSLGSETKSAGAIPFYEYLNQFKGDDHVWMYHTTITPRKEINKKLRKEYYAMNFVRSEAIADVEIQQVSEWMKKLYDLIKEQDDYQGNTKATADPSKLLEKKNEGVDEQPQEEIPTISLDDEIKPEDIPF